jgi:hypothetical protein
VRVDYGAVWEFAHREGLSFKKTVVAAEQTRPDIARKRARWKAYQSRINRKRLVFIDETWVILRLAQDQHGATQGLGAARPAAEGAGPVGALEDHDLPRPTQAFKRNTDLFFGRELPAGRPPDVLHDLFRRFLHRPGFLSHLRSSWLR